MSVWKLTNASMSGHRAVWDVLRDGALMVEGAPYLVAQQYVFDNADAGDEYREADQSGYMGERVGTLRERVTDMRRFFRGEITREELAARWPNEFAVR